MYSDHLRLVGKRVGDFLLVLIELFLLGRTAEALRAIIGSKSAISLQRGPVDPKFPVEGVAPTNHSSSHKTRQNNLSQGIKIWTDFSSVLSQCTRLTDGQTDGQIEISSQDRVCIPCSAVKNVKKNFCKLKCTIVLLKGPTEKCLQQFLDFLAALQKGVASRQGGMGSAEK